MGRPRIHPPKKINAIYCLHCSKNCKQPHTVYMVGCAKRDYVKERLPDKRYPYSEED